MNKFDAYALQYEHDEGPSCDGCKYWSELVAMSEGGEPMNALCLHPQSPKRQQMVHSGCAWRIEGRAIDDPTPTADEISNNCQECGWPIAAGEYFCSECVCECEGL